MGEEKRLSNYEDWRDGIRREKEMVIPTLDGFIIERLELKLEDMKERDKKYHTNPIPVEEMETVIDWLKLQLKFDWDNALYQESKIYQTKDGKEKRVRPIVSGYEDYNAWRIRTKKELLEDEDYEEE